MWIFALLTLTLTALTGLTENEFEILNAPYDLKVRKDNDTSVEIAWNFEKPAHVALREVEFVLLLESERQAPRIFTPRFNFEPLRAGLTDLSPGTEYNVKLWASRPRWPPSAPASNTFVTLETDYPTPHITDVIKNRRGDFVEFLLSYDVEPSPLLRSFEIRVCDRSCFEYRQNRTELQARVPVQYQSKFSISVAAVYDAGDYGFARRESEPHIGETGREQAGKVLDFMSKQEGDRIVLQWHPGYRPYGPTNYYEVFVSNLDENGHVRRMNEELSSDTPAHQPLLDGRALRTVVEFETFNTNRPPASFAGQLDVSKSGQCILLTLVVMQGAWDSRFRIVFEAPPENSLSKISPVDPMRRLYLGSEVVKALRLSPYTRMRYEIRSCITSEGNPVDICGNFTTFHTTSNVAGPSRVLYPEMTVIQNGSILISWQEPEHPRGPIDGYKLVIEKMGNAAEPIRDIVLNATEHEYIFDEYVPEHLYTIWIAAFNVDLENDTIQHVGEWEFVSTPDACALSYVGLPLFIIGVISFMCLSYLDNEIDQQH